MSEQLIPTPGVFGENGNFLLERELGAGGMGGVYMGRDKMLDRPVAVKVMLKEFGSDAEFVEKFKKEAQSAARLIHPNIAQIYSYGICDGMPYIAMELAAGGSLYSIMNANPGKTDVPRILKICQQVAQALQCASDQGCVHGDVKPENILLDANGNAKLVDFGLAAMQKDTDEIWGTPYYISPEKVKKEPIDFRADMYSLGGTLYHALTGVAPFEGEDSIAVVKKRFEGVPEKPSVKRPELTPAIDELVMKMLALNKEDRYPSFEALLEAFRNVLTSGLTNTSATTSTPTAAVAAKKPTGTRRMTVRGRRTTMMKRPSSVSAPDNNAVSDNPSELPAEDTGIQPEEVENTSETDGDEDESGGNLGLKIVGVVVGIIVLIAAIIGGLIWFRVSEAKAREAEKQAQIVAGYGKAQSAIKETVVAANKFADEFDTFAARAVEECQKPTDELLKILPADQAALIKPEPTKELLDAIAATNETPKAVEAPAPEPASTNAAPVAVAATNAPAGKAAAPAATNAPAAKATAPAATNAPATKATAPAAPPSTNAAPSAASAKVVVDMNELWGRAYACQACAVRIRHNIRKLVAKSAEAEQYSETSLENMEKLAELSRKLVEMLDEIKASKDVETVKKGITYIKSKGEKTVTQAVNRLRIEKLENERKAKAEAAAAAEKERIEKLEAEKKAKIEEETTLAKNKFEMISAQGLSMLNNWKNNIRQLETLKGEFETPEGQLEAELQIRKLTIMKGVHDLFIKNLPRNGFEFKKKGKLRGFKCSKANETDLELHQVKGGRKYKASWQKFFKDNYAYVREMMGYFVFNGRKNAGLSQRGVADALSGSALMLKFFYPDEPTAVESSEQLAKEAVAQFGPYHKTAVAIFPDIDFGTAPESSDE